MFYRGTEVGCCAVMHEERKGGSKEGGWKRKQTETNRFVFASHSAQLGRRTAAGGSIRTHAQARRQHTHMQPVSPRPSQTANGDPVVLLSSGRQRMFMSYVFVCACILECISATAKV